jgi:hypothetical protein
MDGAPIGHRSFNFSLKKFSGAMGLKPETPASGLL